MGEDSKLRTNTPNWISPTDVRNAHADANPGSRPPPVASAGDVVAGIVSAAATAAVASSTDDDDDYYYDDDTGAVYVPKTFGGLVIYLAIVLFFGLVVCR